MGKVVPSDSAYNSVPGSILNLRKRFFGAVTCCTGHLCRMFSVRSILHPVSAGVAQNTDIHPCMFLVFTSQDPPFIFSVSLRDEHCSVAEGFGFPLAAGMYVHYTVSTCAF